MTSFINKKITPILLILTTLLIIGSISSVNANVEDVDFNMSYNKNTQNSSGEFTVKDTIKVYGSMKDTGATPLDFNGTLVLRYYAPGSNDSLISAGAPIIPVYNFVKNLASQPINWNGSKVYTFDFTIKAEDVPQLGYGLLTVAYIPRANVNTPITSGTPTSNQGGDSYIGFVIDPSGPTITRDLARFDAVEITVKSPIWIEWDKSNLKVGQDGNITGIVKGYNASNPKKVIGLEGIVFQLLSADGLTWVTNVTTETNGKFSVPYSVVADALGILDPNQVVPSIKFQLMTFMPNDGLDWAPPGGLTIAGLQTEPVCSEPYHTATNFDGTTMWTSNDFSNPSPGYYTAIELGNPWYVYYLELEEAVHDFTASPGKIDIDALWFDSPYGYVVGDSAIIFWNLSGYGDILNQNIGAYLELFDKHAPNNILRADIFVNLTNNDAGYGICPGATGSILLDPFTLTHTNLGVRLVIDGYDYRPDGNYEDGAYIYENSSLVNYTFVDADDNSRRTTVNISSWPPAGLKVGTNGIITFQVKDYKGNNYLGNGSIAISWDGKWAETINVVNGKATYSHVYTLAGINRVLTYQFLGNADFNAGPSDINDGRKVTNVSKGTPVITVAQIPTASVAIGDPVTITALINGLVADSSFSPSEIKFTFTSAGSKVHELTANIVQDQSGNPTIAFASKDYKYIKTHNPVSITAEIIANANYIGATSTAYNVIVTA